MTRPDPPGRRRPLPALALALVVAAVGILIAPAASAGAVLPVPAVPPGTPGLAGVGQWQFDEGAGTVAADAVGNHPLTLIRGAGWTTGLSGSALALAGPRQTAVTKGKVIGTDRRSYSVSAWARLSAIGAAFQTVVSEDSPNNSAFYLQYSAADQRWAFSFDGQRAVATAVGMPQVGRWYHLVGVRDQATKTLTVFVDGQQEGQIVAARNDDVADGPLAVGSARFSGVNVDFLDGAVDDVRVYDRALSPAEVATLFAAGAGGTA